MKTRLQWKIGHEFLHNAAFDAAQKEAANEMSRTATSMRKEAAALDNGTTNASGYDASDLRSIADKLDSGAVALRDDGSEGYVAHVGKASVMTGYFANVDKRGGKVLTVDVTHFQFGGPLTPFAVGHESLHSAGLEDQMDFTGKVPAYRYGSNSESRVAFRYLSKSKRVLNPDHIMCMVYKC